MNIDLSSIPTSPAPAPQSQPAPQANNAQGGNQAQDTQPQNQNVNSGNSSTGNNAGDDNHFSKLLASQGQNQAPSAQAQAPGNNSAPAANAVQPAESGNTSSSSGSGASALVPDNTVAITALLLAQLQAGNATADNAQDTSSQNETQSATDATTATSDSDALQQLQKVLQELLHLAQQSGTGSSSAVQTNDVSTPKEKTASTSKSADPTAQLLAQLAALVQQISGQAPAAQATASAATPDDISVSLDSGSSNNPAAALLAQLSRELSQKLNATDTVTGATSGDTQTSSDASVNTAGTSSFDNSLSALLQSSDTKNTLQSVLSQVNTLLNATPGDKQNSKSVNGIDNNPAANANSATQNLPVASPNTQPIQNDSFVKLVSQASQTQSAADQVLVQIKNANAGDGSQIKIQLQPADLGKVTVQMVTGSDGKTGITITADNRQTLSMLQSEARSLESALRDIGLKTNSGGLNFNLSGQQQQQQSPGQQGGYTQVAGVSTEDDSNYYTAATAVYQLAAKEGLDIRV